MPFAKVMFDKEKVDEADLRELGRLLPEIIAKHLSIHGTSAELSPQDIEIEFSSFGPFDIHHKDAQIIIWANQYPERVRDLDARCRAIGDELTYGMSFKLMHGFCPVRKISYFVWVLLQQGSYSEFNFLT